MTESWEMLVFTETQTINPPHAEERSEMVSQRRWCLGLQDNYECSKQAERREQGIHTARQDRQTEAEPGRAPVVQVRRTVPVGVWKPEAGGQTECTDRGWTIVGLVHS